jgi:heme/copper-type cytochrome/quinol oxidase subunit 3
MTTATHVSLAVAPPAPRKRVGYWGMVLLCLSEAALFAYLISSYFYLGVSNRAWPPVGDEPPSLEKPLVMTALLVSSSIVLLFAGKARERGSKKLYLAGSAGTMLLGLAFLVVQATEFRELWRKMPPSSHAYASMFYAITGFHGTHVAAGLLVLAWTWVADARGRLVERSSLAVTNAALYWHFVDAVWLVILTSLYLSPRWY